MMAPMSLTQTPPTLFGTRAARIAATAGLLIAAACAAGCATAADAPASPHHRGDTFQNTYLEFTPRGLGDLLRWRWNAWRNHLPPAPSAPTPQTLPDLAFIGANAKAGAAMVPAVTWIGHATVLAQLGGLNLLTDPIFSERASPMSFVGPQRAQPPGLAFTQLPHIDVVVVSHNHYDHCDMASLQALNTQAGGPPLFLVPLGLKAWLADIGISNAVELDWWQSHRVGAVDFVLTPVQHWSGRTLTDRLETLWGGWAVFAPDAHLFHAGDTGYSRDFEDIAARFADRQSDGGFDIALIPVGAYEPRWFMKDQHVNPDEAVQIHRDLRARRSLGIHWGTFALTDEPLDEPPRALARARSAAGVTEEAFFLLAIGQTRRLPRRGAPQ
jgi:N-acyl-phosphatidylethanolamine-hydrolysing phospholipase D